MRLSISKPDTALIRRKCSSPGSGCGSVETCRNAARPSAGGREDISGGGRISGAGSMATVQLKNIKKVYPFVSGEQKKKKKKADEPEKKKVNLQIKIGRAHV